MKRLRLGDMLVQQQIITEAQLFETLDEQKESGLKLGELLIRKRYLTEDQLFKVLEEQYGIPYMDINNIFIDPKVPKLISEGIASKYTAIPIALNKNVITVAMNDPLDMIAIDDIKIITGFEVDVVISPGADIKRAINRYYDATETAERAAHEYSQQSSETDDFLEEEDADVTNAPMVRLVNTVITQAVRSKASDIHIEPFERNVRIRYRIDGELMEVMTPAKNTHSGIVTRIKIMGKMNISEKRLPQDGRVETVIEGIPIDMRISILPTVYGEKVVIRLLDRSSLVLKKEDLGFSDHNLERFNKILKVPEGILLVTGPTGSGKTTTLYSVLKELNQINKNIITVEDPVEYRIDGINQVQVNNKAGMTFANGLRSILRQDPDIIMVGEIRDSETAEIAVRAAITGHVVLSTLHTNDTVSTISRLEDMGIEPFLVSSSVVGIIAQRLVKKICLKCKTTHEATPDELKALGMEGYGSLTVSHGPGCNSCNHTGYSGRTAIHEVLVLDRDLRNMIAEKASIDDIRTKAMEKGLSLLNDTCKELVLSGVTSVEEMVRMTYRID
ncbi:GspE/PulE family protein [Fusibacter tunisiensis]|uniref:Type IV pilus assembly protein PilB n=1 Tax=Fusibacter tunisiensis TaxID=1008308 RepID=A0ABS2MQ42_9FIRM|nr:ATPase, T2SS/T4P/T4SS family [Fusibacter tunisiensis]MBM7561521.1 type IV pilus assembly protein PilB [Fusibacter tunisiensis]